MNKDRNDDMNGTCNGAIAEDRSPTPATLDDVARLLRGIRAELRAGSAELLSADEAATFCGMSRASWDRLRSADKVPAPVRPGGGLIRWRRADLVQWIADGCPSWS
jgi:predicted DNA-binding transcriptional regulator AlpA